MKDIIIEKNGGATVIKTEVNGTVQNVTSITKGVVVSYINNRIYIKDQNEVIDTFTYEEVLDKLGSSDIKEYVEALGEGDFFTSGGGGASGPAPATEQGQIDTNLILANSIIKSEGYDDLGDVDTTTKVDVIKITPVIETVVGTNVTTTLGTPYFVRNDSTQATYTMVGEFRPITNNLTDIISSIQESYLSGTIENPEFTGVFSETFAADTVKSMALAIEEGAVSVKVGVQPTIIYSATNNQPFFSNVPFINEEIVLSSTDVNTVLRLNLKK